MSLIGGTCTYFKLAEERTPVAILSSTCDLVLGPCRMNVMVRSFSLSGGSHVWVLLSPSRG